jgi:uncharacterized protein
LDRPELSNRLVSQFTQDPDIAPLMPFYKSYRATVRAKVQLLRSRQPDCGAEDKQRVLAGAGQLLDLALKYTRLRVVLIVCGASGTGKSTLSTMLAESLGLAILNSDVFRKQLAGIDQNSPATAAYNQGIYEPEFTARVYDSLVREAKRVLNAGNGVILDATFGKRSQRRRLINTMTEVGVEPFFIECRADKDVIIQSLSQREHDPQRISDANVAIYVSQVKEFDPLDEIPPASHEVVDTTGDMGAILLKIEGRIYSSQR